MHVRKQYATDRFGDPYVHMYTVDYRFRDSMIGNNNKVNFEGYCCMRVDISLAVSEPSFIIFL